MELLRAYQMSYTSILAIHGMQQSFFCMQPMQDISIFSECVGYDEYSQPCLPGDIQFCKQYAVPKPPPVCPEFLDLVAILMDENNWNIPDTCWEAVRLCSNLHDCHAALWRIPRPLLPWDDNSHWSQHQHCILNDILSMETEWSTKDCCWREKVLVQVYHLASFLGVVIKKLTQYPYTRLSWPTITKTDSSPHFHAHTSVQQGVSEN